MSPRIPDDPVLSVVGLVESPAGYANCVVLLLCGRSVVENTALVGHQWLCVQVYDNGASLVKFCLHLVHSSDPSVLTNGDIGVFVDGDAFSAGSSESVAGSADVDWFAGEVLGSTLAVAFLTVLGTGLVGVAGVYWDSSALVDPLESGERVPAVTGPSTSTVQNVLH